MLTEYLRQYLDRGNFRQEKIREPSLEIAVAEGASSITYLNHPFTVGTEYCFEYCSQFAARLPHGEFLFFDLKAPRSLDRGPFKTIVMIHSIDDFDSPDTGLVFEAFDALLDQDGEVFFSGFTEEYYKMWFPYHVYKFFGGKKDFHAYRKLYRENFLDHGKILSLSKPHGFHITRYMEFICSRRFKVLYIAEKYIFKRFNMGKLRKLLWQVPFLRAMHVRASAVLASAILKSEERAVRSGRRGLNFYCRLSRGQAGVETPAAGER